MDSLTSVTKPTPKTLLLHPYMMLALGVISIGFAPIFIKLSQAPGDIVGAWRLNIGAALLTPVVYFRWKQGKIRIPKSTLPGVTAGGLLFALGAVVFTASLHLTTAAKASLLGNTAPLWVGLGAWLILREKLPAKFWIGLLIAMLGIALTVGIREIVTATLNAGDLLGILNGFSYAVYQLTTKKTTETVDNLGYVWLFSLIGGLSLTIVTVITGHGLFDLSVQGYVSLAALAVISHICGWLLITHAYGTINASLISVALLGQPLITALVAMPILGEFPTGGQIIGGLITLTGIFVSYSNGHRAHGRSRQA